MSQSLTVYSAPNAVSVIETMGRAIAKSQFIKCENAEQGMVLAMTCYAKGMDFLTLAQKYDLIGGRLSMKSDAMLSGLRERGGKHKIIKRTADEACVLLIYDGQEYESRLTWDDVQKEPFIYNGKESETLRFIEAGNHAKLAERLKPKYATPRARMQMLWARVISDGVRALCPEVNTGSYTPEEIDDFEEGSASLPVVVDVAGLEPPPASTAEPIEDAEFEPLASGEQIAKLSELFKMLAIDSHGMLKAFKSVNAESMASVTASGADQLIAKMETALANQSPTPPPVSEAARNADDCLQAATPEQIATIKSLIESVSQKPGMADVPGRIKQHMHSSGVAKISHMTTLSAQALIDALNGTSELETFFDSAPMLAGPPF